MNACKVGHAALASAKQCVDLAGQKCVLAEIELQEDLTPEQISALTSELGEAAAKLFRAVAFLGAAGAAKTTYQAIRREALTNA